MKRARPRPWEVVVTNVPGSRLKRIKRIRREIKTYQYGIKLPLMIPLLKLVLVLPEALREEPRSARRSACSLGWRPAWPGTQ